MRIITEKNGWMRIIESKLVYDYDENDLLICNSPNCDDDSVIFVPESEDEAADFLRSHDIDDLYVLVPEMDGEDGPVIMPAFDFLEDYDINQEWENSNK